MPPVEPSADAAVGQPPGSPSAPNVNPPPTNPPPTNPPPTNPTEPCVPRSDGAREGFQLPEEGDLWIPDCSRWPAREYWRVFGRPSGTAYIIPDPSLPPDRFVFACKEATNPLYGIVNKYSLCGGSTSVANMTREDALAVANYSHANFYFNFYPPMVPVPYIGDVLDACALANADDTAEFHSFCEGLRQRTPGGDAGIVPADGPAGGDLAFRLNQLYGHQVPRYYAPIAPELCGLPGDPAVCTSPGPRYFYDARTASCEEQPFGSCGRTVADFSTREACRGSCNERAASCRCSGASCVSVDCTRCPMTSPASPTACPQPGLECHYGIFAGTTCTCSAGGTWTCKTLLR
jgi:hypothetical protein